MNGREFVRRARRYARRNNLEWRFDPADGKGSHGTFFLGSRESVGAAWAKLRRELFMQCSASWVLTQREF